MKNKQGTYEKLAEISRSNDYITGNLQDYFYHINYYKFIGIDLSRQANVSIPQQINFTQKLKENDGATMFFIVEKQQQTVLILFLNSLIITE